ncbi:MAG: DNA polymerase III subunit beta, partial [Chloroflexi bacterium]|nr:DNA polymerase III subunit beta [Chloroflexota bacterium]
LEITVPARALNELERLLTDDDSAVEMYIHADRTYVRFHVRSVQMTAQLIQGNYPSYDQLIPAEYQTRAILPGAVLQGGVRSAAVFARESSGIIRLIFNGETSDQNITLTARAEELGNHRGRVDAAIEGDDSRIAYNVRYLQDVLQIASGASSAEIAMETSGPSNPGVFRVVGRDNYVHVLMPMFVQWEDA